MKTHPRGFALMEFVIVIAIFAALFMVIVSFGGNIAQTSDLIRSVLVVEQDIGQVFRIMITEVRSAGTSEAGAYAIESASSSSLVFYSDADADGIFERVRYFFSSSTLEKGVVEPQGNPPVYATSTEVVKTAVPNVVATSSFFAYYDKNYTGAESPLAEPIGVSLVRVVRIVVTADVKPSVAPKPTTYRYTVDVRNLRTN